MKDHVALAAAAMPLQTTTGHATDERSFYINFLSNYRKEIRYERARLMRGQPLDYRAIRNLDFELDAVVRRLQEIEADT